MRSVYEETMAPIPFVTPTAAAMGRFAAMSRGIGRDEEEISTLADERAVAVATVHTRQDVAGLVSLHLDLHRQLVAISRGVWILVALAAALAWRVFAGGSL